MKINALIFILIASFTSVHAQELEQLQSLNAKVRSPYIKAEELDQAMIGLRPFEKSVNPATDTLLLSTFQIIAQGYMNNNHFRQAYDVYRRYLRDKEEILYADKEKAIASAIQSVSLRESNQVNEQGQLKSQLDNLQTENSALAEKRSTFKKYFSLILILLSSVFAVLLVSSGIRIVSLRSQLAETRQKMKDIHRLAVTGNFDSGIRDSSTPYLTTLHDTAMELRNQIEASRNEISNSSDALTLVQKIEKNLSEVI